MEYRLEAASPSTLGEGTEALSRLVDLINRVYRESERGMWRNETFQRTNKAEVCSLIRAGELFVARLPKQGDAVAGCVHVKMVNPTLGEFGMLVVDPSLRKMGIGRKLIERAEQEAHQRGAKTMQLLLLHPKPPAPSNPDKDILGKKWYPKLGYQPGPDIDFALDYPDLAAGLASPCHFQIFTKPL